MSEPITEEKSLRKIAERCHLRKRGWLIYSLSIPKGRFRAYALVMRRAAAISPPLATALLLRQFLLTEDSVGDINDEYATARPVGCICRHFLPETLSLRINIAEEEARAIVRTILRGASEYAQAHHRGS